jgi:hypothetical protein
MLSEGNIGGFIGLMPPLRKLAFSWFWKAQVFVKLLNDPIFAYYSDRFSKVNNAKVNKQDLLNFTHCTHSTEGIQI